MKRQKTYQTHQTKNVLTVIPAIITIVICILFTGSTCSADANLLGNNAYNMTQTLSDGAQKDTIAFDCLAFLTGDLCSDSFIPPGKVADFFGFQYLRDNDTDQMGHNTDFLTRIANNVLYILTDSQKQQLAALAEEIVPQINAYGYMRFPLIKAFRRLMEGDIPTGCTGLNKQAVMDYSAQLYRLDGQISYRRAQVTGSIIKSLTTDQRAYLDKLATQGMLSWPNLTDQIDPRNYTHDVHVAIMTFASELFSWYAGSIEADVYFCPERQGTYFGSFYMKDMPAMGNPNYSIPTNLTAEKGESLLKTLTTAQAKLVTDLVDIQKTDLYAIVDRRTEISTLLRKFITGSTVDEDTVLSLCEKYGQLDGEIVYNMATNFASVGKTLSSKQLADLVTLRDLAKYPCSGAYLYSAPISLPEIQNTDFLFTGSGSSTSAKISLSRTKLNFAISGSTMTSAQTFYIKNSGTGTLTWTISTDAQWLSITPTSGTNTKRITVTPLNKNLTPGTYTTTITVSATSALNSPQTITVTLKVYNSGAGVQPFGEIATPGNSSVVSGSIPISGWALDDIQIQNVKLYRGETGSLEYIGEASFIENTRPDVEEAYPDYPNSFKAGWGYMLLTNLLPNNGNGQIKLHAVATDVEGHTVTLGTRTVTCDNIHAVKPFGAIDNPTQGGTASGKDFINWGWALTPQPNTIPQSGSTISIWIDGVNIGHPNYNIARSDLTTLFPGYANSTGPVGYAYIDTTAYTNGIHTIQWSVTDSGGNSDGIGSRYFEILNETTSTDENQTESDQPTETNFTDYTPSTIAYLPMNNTQPLNVQNDFNPTPRNIHADNRGIYNIDIKEAGHIQIEFPIENHITTGFLRTKNQLNPLPTGSTLDKENSTFYWNPGPGFIGPYRLAFITTNPDGTTSKTEITVNIRPRFETDRTRLEINRTK